MAPTETELLSPPGVDRAARVEVSIVVPALNEEITVGEFVDWCRQGLAGAGVTGQILIVDSSSDHTPEIARAHGAEVLRTPKRGLGRAYIDAIPFIRGRYVIMGDADLTYDFRELKPFVEKFREGCEYVMGSRFRGSIALGAMPPLHRYFGTPATTWILNRIYGTRYSDIHCGMRGVTLDGLRRMRLRSQSWQYASELIIKAAHLRLRTAEVPVIFHKDRAGRESHLKRIGWFAPWQAGWISLEAMMTFGADFFLVRPGVAMLALGLIGVGGLSAGPRVVGGIGFSLHWMLAFLALALVGLQACYVGLLARVLFDTEQHKARRRLAWFGFNRAALLSSVLTAGGILCAVPLVEEWRARGYALPEEIGVPSYLAVAGLGLLLAAFIHFTFSLVYNAAVETFGGFLREVNSRETSGAKA